MMTITYKTPNPHGRARDLLIDEMLRKAEQDAEAEAKLMAEAEAENWFGFAERFEDRPQG